MTDEAWVRGMGDLALAFSGRELPPDLLKAKGEVYRRHLDHLSDEEWLGAVKLTLRNERFFPSIAELVSYASQVTGELPEAKAGEVYDAILDAYSDGHQLSPDAVASRFGFEGKLAFIAAGGQNVFAWCQPGIAQEMRRKRFVDTFVRAEKIVPDAKQLTPGEARKLLKGG